MLDRPAAPSYPARMTATTDTATHAARPQRGREFYNLTVCAQCGFAIRRNTARVWVHIQTEAPANDPFVVVAELSYDPETDELTRSPFDPEPEAYWQSVRASKET
jgi:hypothetical protein